MNFWAIDSKHLAEKPSVIILHTKRKPRLAEGDKVILFERKYTELFFYASASIIFASEIEDMFIPESGKNQQKFKLEISAPVLFDEPVSLSEYAFSLQRVYRYRYPYRHFYRPYVSLTAFDFDSILKNRVYWTRTAFGLFANSLNSAQYAQFVTDYSKDYPALVINGLEMRTAWQLLKEFIKDNYIEAANLFVAIKDEARNLENVLPFTEIAVGEDDSDKTDNIAKQTALLYDFLDGINKSPSQPELFKEIDSFIEKYSEEESILERKFRNLVWPYQPDKRF